MRKKKSKKDVAAIFIIALSELFLGFIGVCIFASALVALSGLALPSDLITELVSSRLYKAGVTAKLSLAWAVMYIGLFPIGVGMLVRKEWARVATRRILPLCLLITFPLFFPGFWIIVEKLRIQYILGKAIQLEHAFWLYFFKDIQPWLIFAASMLSLSFLVRKYLQEPPVKALFK